MNMVAEGVKTARPVVQLADEHDGIEMPIAARSTRSSTRAARRRRRSAACVRGTARRPSTTAWLMAATRRRPAQTSAATPAPPPEGWAAAREMNPLEALMWRIEADPRLRSPMTAVDLLDQRAGLGPAPRRARLGTRLVPRFRQRVRRAAARARRAGLGRRPATSTCDYHCGACGCPRRARCEQAARASPQADRDDAVRPRAAAVGAVLFEGLEGGRAAYVLKLHHSLTDGLGGVQLGRCCSTAARASHRRTSRCPLPPEAGARSTPLGVLAEQVGGRLRRAPAEPCAARGGRPGWPRALATRPRTPVGGALRFGALARAHARAAAGPPSPLLRGAQPVVALRRARGRARRPQARGPGRRRVAQRRLHRRAARAACAATTRSSDQPIDELPMAMPISLRARRPPDGRQPLRGRALRRAGRHRRPGRAHPALIHELVLDARDEPALDALGLRRAAAQPPADRRSSPAGTPARPPNLDLQASNVAGLARGTPTSRARRSSACYPSARCRAARVMVTLLSYAGTCCIGVNIDAAAVTEPELFMDCMREGLDEVLALGREDGAAVAAEADGADPHAVDAQL